MGNLDKWTTPKQIKIERKGEPRPLRRGVLKKGERRKGKKARIDEILSAKKEAIRYAEWMVNEHKRKLEHPEWYKSSNELLVYNPEYGKRFDRASLKLNILILAAIEDKVIFVDDITQYEVNKPRIL